MATMDRNEGAYSQLGPVSPPVVTTIPANAGGESLRNFFGDPLRRNGDKIQANL